MCQFLLRSWQKMTFNVVWRLIMPSLGANPPLFHAYFLPSSLAPSLALWPRDCAGWPTAFPPPRLLQEKKRTVMKNQSVSLPFWADREEAILFYLRSPLDLARSVMEIQSDDEKKRYGRVSGMRDFFLAGKERKKEESFHEFWLSAVFCLEGEISKKGHNHSFTSVSFFFSKYNRIKVQYSTDRGYFDARAALWLVQLCFTAGKRW